MGMRIKEEEIRKRRKEPERRAKKRVERGGRKEGKNG